ncbi:MAG: 3-methylcrotonyl-CoA carboxylase beta subunit, partial [Elusimicrobia bacterium]
MAHTAAHKRKPAPAPLAVPTDAVASDTPAIASDYKPDAHDAGANREHHEGLLADLRAKLERAAAGGSPQSLELHRKRGKLTARERIEKLVDPGGPWLELSALAALGMYDDEVPSAGLVAGIGKVAGRWCMIAAND